MSPACAVRRRSARLDERPGDKRDEVRDTVNGRRLRAIEEGGAESWLLKVVVLRCLV